MSGPVRCMCSASSHTQFVHGVAPWQAVPVPVAPPAAPVPVGSTGGLVGRMKSGHRCVVGGGGRSDGRPARGSAPGGGNAHTYTQVYTRWWLPFEGVSRPRGRRCPLRSARIRASGRFARGGFVPGVGRADAGLRAVRAWRRCLSPAGVGGGMHEGRGSLHGVGRLGLVNFVLADSPAGHVGREREYTPPNRPTWTPKPPGLWTGDGGGRVYRGCRGVT